MLPCPMEPAPLEVAYFLGHPLAFSHLSTSFGGRSFNFLHSTSLGGLDRTRREQLVVRCAVSRRWNSALNVSWTRRSTTVFCSSRGIGTRIRFRDKFLVGGRGRGPVARFVRILPSRGRKLPSGGGGGNVKPIKLPLTRPANEINALTTATPPLW